MAKTTRRQKIIVATTMYNQHRHGGGNPLPPAEFPPSTEAIYRVTTDGSFREIEAGDDVRVTAESPV